MLDRWNDDDARAALATWGEAGEDLALRTYTSRLIGADDALVLHGGGNTSVKTTVRDLYGDPVEVVCVKGSGWDLATIAPAGFPAVRLEPMRRLCRMEALSDEAMVNEQRVQMLDAGAPNPSIETLLHAFFPAKFVDHTHADAILALTNHPDGVEHVRACLGPDVCIVPYVKPGFDLARLAARCFDEHPGCTSMVLMQHGLFTWGATAKEAYQHHIELVRRAEAYVAARTAAPAQRPGVAALEAARARAAQVAPLLRGALAEPGRTWILAHRVTPDLLARVDDARIERWTAAGPLTPDHVIRTKNRGLVVRLPDGDEPAVRAAIDAAVAGFRADYDRYFTEQSGKVGGRFTKLDTTPRLLFVPGVGVFAAGESPKACRIALDIAEHTLAVKEGCEGLGPFEGLADDLLFEVEYWSLEQAKLGKSKEKPLQRKVALITGGAGAIGVGVAKQLRAAGACVVLVDRSADALQKAVSVLKPGDDLLAVTADVTVETSVAEAFAAAAARFGGVDVVVPNAGVALSAPITSLSESDWRRVLDVNATGVFLTVREGLRQLGRQGHGGHVVLVSTKNVFGPGAEFAAYSASKAAAHQLCKVAALEGAKTGVKVNMVNPDAVFSQDGVASGLWATVGPDRAKAKGLREDELQEHYRQRNLLRTVVTGDDVGRAVVFFATDQTPTTGASLPVDGGVAEAFPR